MHLKTFIEDVCLASVEKPFRLLAPLNEKHFMIVSRVSKRQP